MYICTNCGHISDKTPAITEIHPLGDGYAYEKLQSFECPCCHYEMDVAEKCRICGEIKSAEDKDFYGDVCEDCLKDKAKELDTVIECAKLCTSREKVKVNPFLVFMFAPETIDEILWDYFNNICTGETFGFLLKGIYQKKAEEWATADMSWFGETLEEVMKNEQNGV